MIPDTKFLFKANSHNIDIASKAILNGEIIIYPTDTLYSFGADAENSDALIKLNKIKKRESPLSILLSNITEIENYAIVDDSVMKKIKSLLPGPFTILLKSKNHFKISKFVQLNSEKIGIRIIDDSFCNGIINKTRKPIITTSVNIHRQPPLNDIDKIRKTFENFNIFYNKKKLISKGSTIIDFSIFPEKIIRYGAGKYNHEKL